MTYITYNGYGVDITDANIEKIKNEDGTVTMVLNNCELLFAPILEHDKYDYMNECIIQTIRNGKVKKEFSEMIFKEGNK